MAYTEIQNAFLDGMEEVYKQLFTDRIFLSLLDTEKTDINVYGETSEKFYLEPTQLIGKISTTFEQGSDPVESINVDAKITIPAKQLITNEVPHETMEDLEKLRQGKFSYDGVDYLIDRVAPRTLIADKWQFYDFFCRVDKKISFRSTENVYE